MPTFTLKARDTRPILEVALKNPDGSAHDLTGSSEYHLHVRLSATTVFTRDMVPEGLLTAGLLRYTWLAADWDELPIPTTKETWLAMEYEVVGGTARLTFPNGGADILRIVKDVA